MKTTIGNVDFVIDQGGVSFEGGSLTSVHEVELVAAALTIWAEAAKKEAEGRVVSQCVEAFETFLKDLDGAGLLPDRGGASAAEGEH